MNKLEFMPRAQIYETIFDGLKAVEIQTSSMRLIAITGIGPRIAHFGTLNGRNLLFWDGTQKLGRNEWRFRGGHRIWITRPGADESEEAYMPDNSGCQATIGKDVVHIIAPPDTFFRIAKRLSIFVEADNKLRIENSITNAGDMIWSGGIWTITATAPDESCAYGIPLGDGSDWDVFPIVYPKKWGGTHRSAVNDQQIELTEAAMIIKAQGIESKRMVRAPRATIGMTDASENLTFLKSAGFDPQGKYPLMCNVAFYLADKNTFLEMELMSPEQTVKPGEQLRFVEIWSIRGAVDWYDFPGSAR